MKNFKNIIIMGSILLGVTCQIEAADLKKKPAAFRKKKKQPTILKAIAEKTTVPATAAANPTQKKVRPLVPIIKKSQVAPAPSTAAAAYVITVTSPTSQGVQSPSSSQSNTSTPKVSRPATAPAASATQALPVKLPNSRLYRIDTSNVTIQSNEDTQNIKFLIPSKPSGIKGKVTSPTEVACIFYHIRKPEPLSISCFTCFANVQIEDVLGSIITFQAQDNYKNYVLDAVKPELRKIFKKNRCNKIEICSLAHPIAYTDLTTHKLAATAKFGDQVPFV